MNPMLRAALDWVMSPIGWRVVVLVMKADRGDTAVLRFSPRQRSPAVVMTEARERSRVGLVVLKTGLRAVLPPDIGAGRGTVVGPAIRPSGRSLAILGARAGRRWATVVGSAINRGLLAARPVAINLTKRADGRIVVLGWSAASGFVVVERHGC